LGFESYRQVLPGLFNDMRKFDSRGTTSGRAKTTHPHQIDSQVVRTALLGFLIIRIVRQDYGGHRKLVGSVTPLWIKECDESDWRQAPLDDVPEESPRNAGGLGWRVEVSQLHPDARHADSQRQLAERAATEAF
jgi:hypothetical protein